jgi:ribosome modulation factor
MAEGISLSWNIDSLNKAYKQGYMAGVMGSDRNRRPAMSEVVLAAWEAGWEDGNDIAIDDAPPNAQIAS